jgi:tetratricopeptide (TPR) repeat protein
MGDCYNELGIPKKALSLYEKIFISDSTNIKAGLKLASTSVDLQKYQYAFDILKKISIKDSTNSYIYRDLGYCAQKLDTNIYGMQKPDTLALSVLFYHKALKLNNDDMVSLQQVVNYYIKKKWSNPAILILKERIAKDPNNALYNRLLGDVYFSIGQYIKALINYSVTMRAGDTTAYLLQKTGIGYYLNAVKEDSVDVVRKDTGYSLSVRILEKSLLLEDNPVTLYYLAQAEQKLGNYKKALDYFNRAIKIIIPGFLPEIYLRMGECYSALNDYPKMLNSYKGALLFNPDNPALLLNIAEVYEKGMSDNASAIIYYKEYLERDTLNNENTAKVKLKINKLNKNN